MDRKIVNCEDCKQPTDPRKNGVYLEMYGWSQYRGTVGGSNNLRWKRQTGKVICESCASDRIHGVKNQSSLF